MTILIISLVFSSTLNLPHHISPLTHLELREAPIPFFLKWMPSMIASNVEGVYINPEIKKHLTFLEGYLGAAPSGGEFFCGALSGADIMMYFSLEAAMARGDLNETSYPKLFSYVRGIQAREAYVKAGNRVSEASGEKFRPFSESKF
jgi:glutathione S-transferase